jgi:hypothetical protein
MKDSGNMVTVHLCVNFKRSAHNLYIARPLQDKITHVTASTLRINSVTKFMCREASLKAERSHFQQFLQNVVSLSLCYGK